MSGADIVPALLYLVPALVWAMIARQLWSYTRMRAVRSPYLRLGPVVAGVLTVHFLVLFAPALVAGPRDPWECVLQPANALPELTWLASAALLRHLLHLAPLPERRATASWLAVNYGLAAGVAAADLILRFVVGRPGLAHRVFEPGLVLLGILSLREAARIARPGVWGPEHAGELRRPDFLILRGGIAAAFCAVPIVSALGAPRLAIVVFEVVIGLAIAAPLVLRMLGHVIPEFLATSALLGATAAVLAAHALAVPRAGDLRAVLDAGTVLLVGLVLAPGAGWLRARINRVVFRTSLRQHAELQAFVPTLSPELGTRECCRRALGELVRVRRLRGAAIILADGEAIVQGEFNLEPLLRVWPRGTAADALPARCFGTAELRELPLALRDALVEARVGLGVAPILGRRGRWGHLFMNTGLLGGTFREDDLEAFQAFVAQLALVLDAAALLERAVAVERSLAHAEKLAAIGELTARVAHEIRNPVTAARSLAQQLARAPADAEAAGLILAELERVERQVAALLRFARRDELHLEPIDVGALVRATLAQLAPRLDAAGIVVELDVRGSVGARADREKLRQVLINLVENAIDALAEAPEKRLPLAVANGAGAATIRLADTGPGVPADALKHLFEPFFSLKLSGTGLGLAIAKRTVEAHGGRITAAGSAGGGMAFDIALPVAEAL